MMDEAADLSTFFNTVDAVPRFHRRGEGIPGDFRTAWRLSVLCILLRHSRADSAAHGQLHTLWWAIRSAQSRDLFLRWHDGEKSPDELLVRFDPSVDVTIDLAIGGDFVTRKSSGVITLTASGRALADWVLDKEGVLMAEKDFLSALPGRVTQTQIRELLEWT